MSRIIKDCIYRFVELSPLRKLFLDTPEFQRLRNLKQLGFVHFVYPSAVHTRFEHSLGVSHLAGVMVDQLRNTVDISAREKELVQLAGLLHDWGHGPFSHFFVDTTSTHEERGILLLKQVNHELQEPLDSQELQQVADMIAGRYQDKKEKAFLYEIVCNPAGIDVDRLDYLQRDSYHTGMPVFQPDYILRHAYVDAKTGRLQFRDKAAHEIQRMLETRRLMFELVYRHPVVQRIEKIVRALIFRYRIQIHPLEDDDADVMARLKKVPEYQEALCYRRWGSPSIRELIAMYDAQKVDDENNAITATPYSGDSE